MSIPFLSKSGRQGANDYRGNPATREHPSSSMTRFADFSAQPSRATVRTGVVECV